MQEIALAITSIVLMLAAGISLKRFGILRREDADTINKIVIYATLPAFAFIAVYQGNIPLRMAQVPFLAFGVELVVMALAWLIGRALRLDRPTLGGLMLAATYGNTGFLGYPVVSATFPAGMGTAVIFDNFGMALPLYTLGVSVAAHMGGGRADWRRAVLEFVKLPVFGMTILALLIRWLAPGSVPGAILKTMDYLRGATVPLVMISLGLTLSWGAVHGQRVTVLAACVIKLVVFPVLMILLLSVVHMPYAMHKGMIFESSMPSAMMTGVIASRYHANGRFVSAAIVISTLLSIIILPVFVYYAG